MRPSQVSTAVSLQDRVLGEKAEGPVEELNALV
jgi:hypothetical protein